MKNQSLLNFLIFTCFLVIGYSVSTRFYRSDYGSLPDTANLMTTRSSISIQSLNNGQRSILLIGVDSIDTSKPHLESLWLVTYLPSDSTLRMFPVYPTGKESISNFEEQLHHSFAFNSNNGNLNLGHDFIKTLEENNYWWSGYFIFDHVALIKMLNHLGKLGINGQIISENQAIQEFSEAVNDPQNAFSTQLAIVQTACQKLAGLKENPDWSKITSLITTHILTDLDIPQFMMEWEASLSSQPSPNCMFPTLEISRIDN